MSKAVVLLSGGLDSTVLLHYVAGRLQCPELHVLSFRYGQRHDRELDMARWQARQLSQVAGHTIADVSVLGELLGGVSTLVAGGQDVPDLQALSAAERTQPPTYVPNRNMILLALGAAFAEAKACGVVFYGAQAQDCYGYWDCTVAFVNRMNEVLALNRRRPVRIEAPFADKRKAEEIALGSALGVDFSHTWSCYRGGEHPCGTCPTCVERQRAFAEAGIADPLESA